MDVNYRQQPPRARVVVGDLDGPPLGATAVVRVQRRHSLHPNAHRRAVQVPTHVRVEQHEQPMSSAAVSRAQ
jgi:hypothetical protein